MASQESVQVFAGDEADRGPSLEEQYESLVEEGVISEEQEEGSNDERPAWLPEKFKSPEDMAKAYEELQKKLSKGGKEPPEEDAEDNAPPPEASLEQRKAAEEATAKAGLDLQEVSKEWMSDGELSADTYTKLEKAGYPREMVDVYIEGLTSRTTKVVGEAYAAVGGEETYNEMIDWAINNLSPEDQAEYDRAVNSGNRFVALSAVKALKADYESSKGGDAQEPEEIISAKGAANSSRYETFDDYMEDLNDPRYDTNEGFRNKVAQKLSRSNIM